MSKDYNEIIKCLESASQQLMASEAQIEAEPNTTVFDASLARMVCDKVEEIVRAKEEQILSLTNECKLMEKQIIELSNRLEDKCVIDAAIAALPLKPRKQRLLLILGKVEEKAEARQKQIDEYKHTISVCCSGLCIPEPELTQKLTLTAVAEIRTIAEELQTRREAMKRKFKDCLESIDEMCAYLGTTFTERPQSLSNSELEKMEIVREKLFSDYEARKTSIESMKDSIETALAILELPQTFFDRTEFANTGAPGSDEVVNNLERQIEELKILRSEKIHEFIEKTLKKIEQMYEKLYFDVSKRTDFRPMIQDNEECLQTLEHELAKLHKLEFDSDRKPIVDLLTEFEQVLKNEDELQKASQDSNRLAKGGFAAILNREQRLKKFNDSCVAKTMASLEPLVAKYNSKYNETFTFHGKPVSELILSRTRNNRAKRQMNQTTSAKRRQTMHPNPRATMTPTARPPQSQASIARAQAQRRLTTQPVMRPSQTPVRREVRPTRPVRPPQPRQTNQPRQSRQLQPQSQPQTQTPRPQRVMNALQPQRSQPQRSQPQTQQPQTQPQTQPQCIPTAAIATASSTPRLRGEPLTELNTNAARAINTGTLEFPEWGEAKVKELREMDISYFDPRSFEYSRDAF